jgi:hypothetical protein
MSNNRSIQPSAPIITAAQITTASTRDRAGNFPSKKKRKRNTLESSASLVPQTSKHEPKLSNKSTHAAVYIIPNPKIVQLTNEVMRACKNSYLFRSSVKFKGAASSKEVYITLHQAFHDDFNLAAVQFEYV